MINLSISCMLVAVDVVNKYSFYPKINLQGSVVRKSIPAILVNRGCNCFLLKNVSIADVVWSMPFNKAKTEENVKNN